MPSCPRCGLTYDSHQQKCSRCGSELPVIETSPVPTETDPTLPPARDRVRRKRDSEYDQPDRPLFEAGYKIVAPIADIQEFGMTQIVQRDGQQYLLKSLFLPQEDGQVAHYHQLFEEECRFLRQLSHYGLPSIVEFAKQTTELRLLLTYPKGTTLLELVYPSAKSDNSTVVDEPRLPSLDLVIRWARQLAQILQILHTQRPFPIFHRNLSPACVLVTQPSGDIQLLDFGLLRSFEAIASTSSGSALQPGCYADPALTVLQEADARSDVFAYGRILDLLLTGTVPSSRGVRPTITEDCQPRSSDPRFSTLVRVIEGCCQLAPGDRYQSMMAVLDNLAVLDQGVAASDTEDIQCVCGQLNRPSARFCKQCGQLLHSPDADSQMHAVPIEIAYDEPAANELLASYEQARFTSLGRFKLREALDQIQSDPGFDTLLCLDALPQVDRNLPHQQEAALRVLKQMRGRALLADEVGLGKTIEAGLVLKELLERQLVENVLIFTPVQLLAQWQLELYDKFDELFLVMGRNVDTSLAWHCPRLIAPYHIAEQRFHVEEMLRHQYDLVVLDEAHYLNEPQNWKALRTIQNLRKKYFLLLSATPMHNDPEELYNIVTLLRPGHFEDWERFRNSFVDDRLRFAKSDLGDSNLAQRLGEASLILDDEETPDHAFFSGSIRDVRQLAESLERIADIDETEIEHVLEIWEQAKRRPRRVKNTSVLRSFLQQVMVRNVRSEVAKHYPFPVRRARRYEIEMLPAATEYYARFRNFYQQRLRTVHNRRFLYEMGELVERLCSSPAAFRESVRRLRSRIVRQLGTEFYRELEGFAAEYPHELVMPKIQTALARAKEFVADGHRVLVFSQFNETARYVFEEARDIDLEGVCLLYDEAAHPQEKSKSLREFYEARAGVLFCPGEASEGLNLQHASVMINLDLPWDPMKIEQRIGRIQRIGGHREVMILNLVLKGTIEEEILRILEQKIQMFEAVVGKVEEIIGNLSDADDFRAMVCNLYLDREEEDEEGEAVAPQQRIDRAIDEAIERSSSQESEDVLRSIFLDFTDIEDDEW